MHTIPRPSNRDPLASAAKMFDAAMPTGPALKAAIARQEQIRSAMADAAIVAEACRLTDQLCDVHWANRGVKHSATEIAAIALGYFRELTEVKAAPRESPDPYVLIDGEPFHFHAESDGFYWNRAVPQCPGCGDELSRVNSRELSGLHWDANPEPIHVVCSSCTEWLAVLQ